MKFSQLMIPTQKELPADAQLASHQLMIRAGLIRRLASGLYTWLPMGLLVLRRVERLIHQTMQSIGVQEVLMPMVQPAEIWQSSGRWQKYGQELLRLQDRHERAFCLGPTHEEVITQLAKQVLTSHKQLPLSLYQIQTKFRDEIRPRFGVMRGREFVMKDAYSFHVDAQSLHQCYEQFFQAYQRIFTQLGLDFCAVIADTGAIGGAVSHEFQVLTQAGEDCIAYVEGGEYAANIERAEAAPPQQEQVSQLPQLEQRSVSDTAGVGEALAQWGVSAKRLLTTHLYRGRDVPLVAVVVRSDHEVNPIKLTAVESQLALPLMPVSATDCQRLLGCSPAELGPKGLDCPMIVDVEARALAHFACPANQPQSYWLGVQWDRDIPASYQTADVRFVCAGDPSPCGQGVLQLARGIEVGQVFQLGDCYSRTMGLSVQDDAGQALTPLMGCYGIGVSRVVAAAIEQHHDERGIIWSATMAPFDVVLIPIGAERCAQVEQWANDIYTGLQARGVRCLYDDRSDRPGKRFADADLLGIPHRLVVSARLLAEHQVEYKARTAVDPVLWSIDCAVEQCVAAVSAAYQQLQGDDGVMSRVQQS